MIQHIQMLASFNGNGGACLLWPANSCLLIRAAKLGSWHIIYTKSAIDLTKRPDIESTVGSRLELIGEVQR